MNNRNTIQEELKALNSSLPSMKKPVFVVPEGYFENFVATVLAKLRSDGAVLAKEELKELSPVLAGLSKKMPFSVPENYFQTFENEVPVLMSNEQLPSILTEHDKKIPYQIPAGYFDNLATQVIARVNRQEAKVISIGRPRWMRMAVAAMVAGLIALSSVLYFTKNNTGDAVKDSGTWVAKNLQGVSNKDLEEFVYTTDVDGYTQIAEASRTAEVRSMLQDVSDGELDSFLEQVPTDDQEFVLIN